MRILHVTPYYAPAYAFGGVVRAVEGMAGALSQRGHEVTILTTDALDQEGRTIGARDENVRGVPVLRCPNVLPRLRGRLNISTPRGMRQTAAAILPEIDLVHVHEFRTLENLLVTPVARDNTKPLALSPHGTLNLATGRRTFKRAWDRLLSPSVALRIDQVIALTEAERAEAEALWRRFGPRQQPTGFSVVPNGVDLGDFDAKRLSVECRRRFKLGDAPTALFVGRLQARKGVDILIQAFQAAAVDEARLLIVGPDEGMLPALKTLAAGDPRIIFAGYLDGEARLGALAAADLSALPATGEGQPMAALEAMAAGLPVVLSPGCHLDEAAAAGAGFVLEASVEAFADGLRALLQDADLRQRMGARARRLAEERFSWEQAAAQLEDLYTSLV